MSSGNTVQRQHLELAVAEATVVYNDGEIGIMPIYNKLGLSCGTFTVNEMKRIDSKRITNAYIPGTSSVISSQRACAGISKRMITLMVLANFNF